MPKAKFMNARLWRFMMESIEKVIAEGVFLFDNEGVKLRSIDPSKIIMVDLFYPKEAFSEYNIEQETVLGINFDETVKVFRRALKNDVLSLEFDESNIYIELEGRGRRIFKLPQIQLPYEKLPEPKVDFTVHAKMMGSVFSDIIRDIEIVGGTLSVLAKGEKLYIASQGEIEEAEVELSLEKQNLTELAIESEDEAMYSTGYLSAITKAAKVADTVELHYAQDAPLKVNLKYMGGGRLTFYVSPIIT